LFRLQVRGSIPLISLGLVSRGGQQAISSSRELRSDNRRYVRFEVFMAVLVSSRMLRRVALVGTDVVEELSDSFIRVGSYKSHMA
jgi:hypothetical protein